MSENGKFKDILHYLEIRDLGDKGCSFLLCERNNFFKMKEYKAEDCLISDPAWDINFKALFIDKPERFANFLNCVFFHPRNKEISQLEFLVGDFHVIGIKYDLNRLSADIACKGKIKEINKDNQIIDGKETLLDIEVQINLIGNLDNRLFEYGSVLRYKYANKIREEQKEENSKKGGKKLKNERIYLDTLVIAFIIGNKKAKSNEIKLIKESDGNPVKLNMFNIVEINVFNEYELIKISRTSPLLGQLSKDGQDWIKLLSLRSWTKIGKKTYKYIFPKLPEGHKYSSNNYINEAILELIHGNKYLDEIDLNFENYANELLEKEKARFKIVKAYYYFYINHNIDNYIFESEYCIDDIEDILNNEIESEMLKDEIMKNFILALEKKGIVLKEL